jgi:hypothetical protein
MDSKKYIGMDVHQATISVAVRDSAGKLVMESILETKASTLLEFMRGLDGSLWVTFELTALQSADPASCPVLLPHFFNSNSRYALRSQAVNYRVGLLNRSGT